MIESDVEDALVKAESGRLCRCREREEVMSHGERVGDHSRSRTDRETTVSARIIGCPLSPWADPSRSVKSGRSVEVAVVMMLN